MEVLYEPEKRENSSSEGVIAEFRNELGEFSVNTWHGVMASILYYNEQGEERADIGRATWLEESSYLVDLESHKTWKLVVAVRTKDAWIGFDEESTGLKFRECVLSAINEAAQDVINTLRPLAKEYGFNELYDATRDRRISQLAVTPSGRTMTTEST